MKIANSQVYGFSLELSEDLAKHYVKLQREKLFADLSEKIEPNRWYLIRLSDRRAYNYTFGETTYTLYLDCETAKEKQVLYHSSEEMYLKTAPKFSQKLKNCIKYLRDKSGGTIVVKDIKEE